MLLPEPMEFLDLHPGASIVLSIDRFEDGTSVIYPRKVTQRHRAIHMQQNGLTEPPSVAQPIGNEIPVLRLFGHRVDQPSPARYYDVSSKTLRADLLARLTVSNFFPVQFKLTAEGAAPQKRYSVEPVSM